MNLPDYLVPDAHGEILVRGTRVGLFHLLTDYNAGESAESLAVQFPQVPLATVHKAIAFYLENRPAVDAYLKQYADDMADQRAIGRNLNLAELRGRLTPTGATATSN